MAARFARVLRQALSHGFFKTEAPTSWFALADWPATCGELARFNPQRSQRLRRDCPGDLERVVRLHAQQPGPQFRIHLPVYLAAVVAECEQGELDLLDDLLELVGIARERLERRGRWGDRRRLVVGVGVEGAVYNGAGSLGAGGT